MKFFHGGDIESFAVSIFCSKDEVIDLSSNINFIKPKISIDMNNIAIDFYPRYDELYEILSKHFKINSSNFEVYNGGSSAIFSLMNFFPHKNCYIYSPAYLEYKKAALQANKNIKLINRFKYIDENIEPNSLVIFVNPSTPDGKLYDIKKLLKYWDEKSCTVIIDESFLEFTDAKSVSKYIKRYPNLYILKSMTKFYSCAGVRVGCVLSNKKNISKLKTKEPLWKLSQFDSLYMQELLKDKKFRKRSLYVNKKAKKYLEKTIKKFDIFENSLESNANFILVKLRDMNSHQFQELLKPFKIMIRDCSNFDFLDDSYVRIAVKSKKNMKIFRKAIEKIVS